jgi:hypothetical protein
MVYPLNMMATSFPTPQGEAQAAVRQIAVPDEARAVCTLTRLDYEDAFEVDVGAVQDRTAEQWARAVLEESPLSIRSPLVAGWSAIGLKLGFDRSRERVLGWEITLNTSDVVLLGAGSRIGLLGQLLFKRHSDRLLFCTFVQQGNAGARAMWAWVEPVHAPTVRRVLEQAGRRCHR